MAGKYLGPAFDIHGGGVDLRFPHHENEQAQSRAAGHPFASYWLHNAWITTAGEKMSKSLGNSLLIPSVLERVRGIELRFYIVAAHYRSHVEFSFEALDEAAAGFRRIENFLDRRRRAGRRRELPAGVRRRARRRPRYTGRGRRPLRHRPRGQQAPSRRPVGALTTAVRRCSACSTCSASTRATPWAFRWRRGRHAADAGRRCPRAGTAHAAGRGADGQGLGRAPTRSVTRSRLPASRSRTPRPDPSGAWERRARCLATRPARARSARPPRSRPRGPAAGSSAVSRAGGRRPRPRTAPTTRSTSSAPRARRPPLPSRAARPPLRSRSGWPGATRSSKPSAPGSR